jgi:hypothetical protein
MCLVFRLSSPISMLSVALDLEDMRVLHTSCRACPWHVTRSRQRQPRHRPRRGPAATGAARGENGGRDRAAHTQAGARCAQFSVAQAKATVSRNPRSRACRLALVRLDHVALGLTSRHRK